MRPVDYFYDVPLPNPHSATIQIVKTGLALAEAGRDFTFAAREPSEAPEVLLAALGVAPHPRFRFAARFPNRPRTPMLRRLLIGARPPQGLADVDGIVVTRGETGLLIAPALRRRRLRPAFVYELHRLAFLTEAERVLGRRLEPGEPLPPTAGRMRGREARIIAASDGLIFLTEEIRQTVRQAFGFSAPSVVAPSGVELGQEVANGAKDVDAVYLGKIEARKGVDIALRTMRHLPERRLRLIGDGPGLPWARDLARELGVADRVEFVGRIPHAEVPRLIARARIGLCPLPRDVDHVSERFTSPLKLLEMMAAGLPVVATDLPSVRAVCTDQEHALLAPPESPELIAACIQRLLREPAEAARLGGAARRRAGDFSWRARARTIADLLDAIPARGTQSR